MPTKITWCEHTSTVKTFSCILSEEELALYNEGDEQFSECGEFFQHCDKVLEDEHEDYEDAYNIDIEEVE
ncbi:MAG: hypothetical protein NT109_10530 [Flavobacteriia bacterium]|nr:hypothetical protein [Flavobacteriia bacterium]